MPTAFQPAADAPAVTSLPLTDIFADPAVQMRVGFKPEVAREYAQNIADWIDAAPLVVIHDAEAGRYYVASGFHRHQAASLAGLKELPCIVKTGTRDDASWIAAGSNNGHTGERWTLADKRHAAEKLLRNPTHAAKSDREIAEQVDLSDKTVASVRRFVLSCGNSATEHTSAPSAPASSDPVPETETDPSPTPTETPTAPAPTPTPTVSTPTPSAPARRIGKDGKLYQAKKPAPAAKKEPLHRKTPPGAKAAAVVAETLHKVNTEQANLTRRAMFASHVLRDALNLLFDLNDHLTPDDRVMVQRNLQDALKRVAVTTNEVGHA